jgi:hypothetical protein
VPSLAQANKDAEDRLLLKEMYRKIGGVAIPKGEEVYFFQYQVKTTPRNTSFPVSSIKVDMFAGKDFSILKSSEVDVYQDKINSFSLMPQKKMIYWGDSKLGKGLQGPVDISSLKEKLFDSGKILSSLETGNKEKKYDKEILFEPGLSIRQKTGIESMKFLIDSKSKTIVSILLYYNSTIKIKSVQVDYLQMDFNYKHLSLSKNFKSKFLDNNGKLQSAYKGYQLVDVRNKKN